MIKSIDTCLRMRVSAERIQKKEGEGDDDDDRKMWGTMMMMIMVSMMMTVAVLAQRVPVSCKTELFFTLEFPWIAPVHRWPRPSMLRFSWFDLSLRR